MAIQYNGSTYPSKAPNLLIAPVDYTQAYQDQMNNALRLYFNQIDNFTQSLAIPNSGKTTQRPTANLQVGQQFFDTTIVLPIWWTGTKWINASGTAV
jgi:hypothetical protein